LRVRKHPAAIAALAAALPAVPMAAAAPPPDPLKDYLDRLVKMIPGGVVGFYLVGSGIVEKYGLAVHIAWVAICLIATIVVQIWGTSDGKAGVPVEWPKVVISSIAFLIWVYTLGQQWLASTSIYSSAAGSLAMLVWTFFIPIFYK
jgi:hypothetical protein